MKQLSILILSLFIFSCDKDEAQPFSETRTEQEIFNAVVGTWRPYRLAYDAKFEQIECMMDSPCEQKYHVTFNTDSTASVLSECINEYEQGVFYIKKQEGLKGGIDIKIKYDGLGIFLSPTISRAGGVTLYNYTDSTLIFSEVGHDKEGKYLSNLYSEFKRVK